jgi:hypothetical protein
LIPDPQHYKERGEEGGWKKGRRERDEEENPDRALSLESLYKEVKQVEFTSHTLK